MIPVCEPWMGETELEYVSECVRTGWVSSAGRFIDEFEQRWAEYCGCKYGVAVSSGTAALHVAVAALGLEPGDEIIMPTFTIISCAQAATLNGMVPVLVDSEPRTWCMDTSLIESAITSRTRAIMPVHIYGHPVDMDPVLELAEKYSLAVIEDAAEAHGAEYLSLRGTSGAVWRRCGGMGTISAFSFYANKLVTTGEGGMVLTDSTELAERARSLRNLCFRRDRRFYHDETGHNFRLTNLQAAIGLAQMQRMPRIIDRKRWIAEQYTQRLKDIAGLKLPVEESWARSVFWMYAVELTDGVDLDAGQFGRELRHRGVDTRPFFLGMHEQPTFHKQGLFTDDHHPVAERIARYGLYLPSGLTLTEEQIDSVCTQVREVVSAHSAAGASA